MKWNPRSRKKEAWCGRWSCGHTGDGYNSHAEVSFQNCRVPQENIIGGEGMSDDTPIAMYYRGERAARIYDGADEVHKISVGRKILIEY
jgi:alkylation response protein AidB-like acyl-CoA dehydrogenase